MKRISLGLAVLLLIVVAALVNAQTITWAPATGWTDNASNTGTFTPEEMGTMKFYLRAKKEGVIGPRALFGETVNGVDTWTGDFATEFLSKGLPAPVPGDTWEFTVSQAYMNPSGEELESAESAVALYPFPFGPSRTPAATGAPVISE